jgi:hypothetical protein
LHYQLTRWIVLQKARSHPEGLLLLVRIQFQVLFHSPSGVLFAFPSRYLFTIDRTLYLALEGGPPSFSQGFTCPDLLENIDKMVASLGIPGCHCLWQGFPSLSTRSAICNHFGDWCQHLRYQAEFSIAKEFCLDCLYLTTPYRYSSDNLFAPLLIPKDNLPGKNLKGLGSTPFARHY